MLLGSLRVFLFLESAQAARRERVGESAAALASVVEAYLAEKRRAIIDLARFVEDHVGDWPVVEQRLSALHRSDSDFLTLLVADRTGSAVATERKLSEGGGPFPGHVDSVADRDYFRQAMSIGGPYVSGGFVGRGFGSDAIVAVAAPWKGADDLAAGVVEGSLDLRRLRALAAVFSALPEVEVWIVDAEGRLLWSGPQREDPALAPVEVTRQGAWLAGGARRAFLVGRARVAGARWQVVVQQPRSALYATIVPRQLAVTGGWTVASFLLSAGLAVLLARRVTRPIESVARAMDGLDSRSLHLLPDATRERMPREMELVVQAADRLLERNLLSRAQLDQVITKQEATIARRTEALRASEERARTLVEESLAFVCSHDLDGRLIFVNAAAARELGVAPEWVVGKTLYDIVPIRYRSEVDAYLQVIRAEGRHEGLLQVRKADGEEGIWRYHNRTIRSPEGEVVIGFALDATEQLRSEAELRHRASHDVLTGLANRAELLYRLREAIALARRHHGHCAVVFFDLDEFKPINDRLGHAAGDEVLRLIAQRLSTRVRKGDTAARLGGDEFAVVLADVASREGATRASHGICDAISMPYRVGAEEVCVGVSSGLAFFPDDGVDEQALLEAADASMYRMKGRSPGRGEPAGS